MNNNETRKNFGDLTIGETFRVPSHDTLYVVTYVNRGTPMTTVEFNLANVMPNARGMNSLTRVNLSTVYVIGN